MYSTQALRFSLNYIRGFFVCVAAHLVIKEAEYISTGIIWYKSDMVYADIIY